MNLPDFTHWQWFLAALGAFLVGFSKTSIGGVGSLAIVVFATLLPARQSTGTILPLLVCADIVAVAIYRRHAMWSHLVHLLPSAIVGIFIGYFYMQSSNDLQVQRLMGIILVAMVLIHLWRQSAFARKASADVAGLKNSEALSQTAPKMTGFAVTMGILTGFTTMVANAAGPVVILYMLSARLPKMEFLGTGAWCFFILNTFKLPFSYHLGLINPHSLALDLIVIPALLLGAFTGKAIIHRIPQKPFEAMALIFTVIGALRLLLS